MKIDIISDVTCPWCYVGKKNLEAAMAQCQGMAFEVQWFPYQLHPEAPAAGYPYRETLEKKYGSARIEQMFAHLTETGRASGIDFQLQRIKLGANTVSAHRLLDFAWQRGLQSQLAEAFFKAYFCEGRFIGDEAVLSEIAGDTGLDREEVDRFLSTEEGIERIEEQIRFARQSGVTGVPSFSFDGKFVLSGGQPVEVFANVIERVNQQTGDNEREY